MGSVPFLAWAHLLPTIAHPPESDAANPLQIRWFSSLSKIRSCCQPHNWNLSLGVFGEWLWILMDECPSLTTNWAIMRDVKFLMQKHSGCVASDALLRASYSNGAWDLVGLFSLSSVFTNTSSDLGHIRFWERKGALCVCVWYFFLAKKCGSWQCWKQRKEKQARLEEMKDMTPTLGNVFCSLCLSTLKS